MTIDSQIEALRKLFQAQPTPPSGALIRVVVQTNPTRFVAGRVLFSADELLPRDAESSAKSHVISYSRYTFLAEWISPAEDALMRWAQLLRGNACIAGVDVAASFYPVEVTRTVPGSSFGDDPTWLEYRCANRSTATNQGAFDASALLEFGRPGYDNVGHLVLDRVMDRPTENPNNARAHEDQLLIALPDRRARFVEAVRRDGVVTAKICAHVPLQELEVHLIDHQRVDTTKRAAPLPDSTVSFSHPAPIRMPDGRASRLALVHRELGLIAQIYPSEADGDAKLALSIAELAGDEVLRGESDHVECKPWVSAGSADKELEFIETLAAFANGRGGRLYVGIHAKTRRPLGHQELCRRFPGNSREQALAAAKDRLIELIQDGIEPVPRQYDILDLELQGEPVLAIEMPEGNNPPYVVKRTKEVLVRSGSSNRLPTPTEYRELSERHIRAAPTTLFSSLTGRPFWSSTF